uniref:SET domain-containing protein n=1 Tax=Corethron hystrix TaxID=216773 RepID=A0A7S1G0D7_9STRA
MEAPDIERAGLNRYSNPGAGAITYYHNVEFLATKQLEAGTEIFLDYGVDYTETRPPLGGGMGLMPLEEDFKWADSIINKLMHSGLFEANDDSEKYYRLLRDIVRTMDRKKAKTLPEHVSDLKKASEEGAALYSDQDYIRSMDWLAENGACVDSMEGKLSTIQGAGRGAFLKRSVKKGDVIVTSPVIHFPYNNVMNMYDVQKKKNRNGKDDEIRASGYTADFYDGKKRFFKNRKKGENIIGRQLLVNYCFGHPDSTVLLFPYLGNVGLINHGAEGKSNVKVQWPSSLERGPARKFHRKDWLDSTTEQLADIDKQKPGMMIEIVATRDIEKDEEVFLDYGPAWENVWDDHVRQWKPWSSNKKYVPAQDLNRTPLRGEPLEKVRLEKELREDPYPGANIATGCYLDFNHINILEEVLPDTEEEEEDEKIRRDIINWYQPSSVNFEEILTPANIQPCVIIDRQTVRGKDYYTALISANPIMDPTDNNDLFLFELVNLRAELEVRKIPREAITFIDKPLTSDVHMKGTFRFPIMLPDEVFPEKWKNNKSN